MYADESAARADAEIQERHAVSPYLRDGTR